MPALLALSNFDALCLKLKNRIRMNYRSSWETKNGSTVKRVSVAP